MSERALPPFGGEDTVRPLGRAGVAVLPVPYEGTVSYGQGASMGPAAILRASTQVELYDEELGFEPCRVGFHTDPLLPVSNADPPEEVVSAVERRFGELMDAGAWVMMLGGEHSVTPGGIRAAAARHEGLHVVQLDAHADLRDEYEGSRFSHACAMARAIEIAPVHAVGIRAYCLEEAEKMRALDEYRIVHAWEMGRDGTLDGVIESVRDVPVYLTVDVDYFDPAVVPATGTPEPGGGSWRPTLRFLEKLFAQARVVACDVVELAPAPGLHHADFTVARLVHKLIGLRFRSGWVAGA